jgi:hypothetical protein
MALPIVYFRGGEMGDFHEEVGLSHSTTSGDFRAGVARAAVDLAIGVNNRADILLPGLTSLWFSCRLRRTSGGNVVNLSFLRFFHGEKRINLRYTNDTTSSTINIFDADKSEVIATSASTINTTILWKLDLQFLMLGDGLATIRVYHNGILLVEAVDVDIESVTNTLEKIELGRQAGGIGRSVYSEVIVANVPTLNMGDAIKAITGDGFHDDQTGDFEDINALAINDSTGVGLENDGDEYSVSLAALSGSEEAFVWGVSLQMRAARGPVGPTHLDFGVRRDGTTTYDPSARKELPLVLGPVTLTMPLDPVTNAPWDKTDLDASELVIKAVEV